MFSTTINNDDNQLIYRDGNYYKIYFNIVPNTENEKIFKNSAFVETGRKILTGTSTAYYTKMFSLKKPSIYEIIDHINKVTDTYTNNKILRDFVWNGYEVWLSKENQLNYSSWLIIAQDNEDIFPLCAKFKKDKKEIIYNFSNFDELKDFCTKMVKFINDCVIENRNIKANIDKDMYIDSLKNI